MRLAAAEGNSATRRDCAVGPAADLPAVRRRPAARVDRGANEEESSWETQPQSVSDRSLRQDRASTLGLLGEGVRADRNSRRAVRQGLWARRTYGMGDHDGPTARFRSELGVGTLAFPCRPLATEPAADRRQERPPRGVRTLSRTGRGCEPPVPPADRSVPSATRRSGHRHLRPRHAGVLLLPVRSSVGAVGRFGMPAVDRRCWEWRMSLGGVAGADTPSQRAEVAMTWAEPAAVW